MENPDIKWKGITLQEALDLAYDDENVTDIYIEPPDCNILTDEDSADEDDGGLADNLNPRQLLAPAEVVFANSERLGSVVDENEVMNEPSEVVSKSSSNLLLVAKPTEPKFIQGDLQSPIREFPAGDYSKYSSMSPVEIFELFFSDDLLQNITKESANYALLKNRADPQISIEELKVFIGILILSGVNVLPSKRNYWQNSSDMKNVMVSESMRRDRFFEICKNIHFADNNNIDPTDKMFKLRPLTDHLKTKFLDHFVPEENLSYDESMIRYFGRHGCKQFIRGKPVRFGYKVWCLNTPSGYLVNFEIYQGKNPRSNPKYEQVFGKPTAPLLQMIDELGDKKSYRFNFFIDNLFTTANLLCTLKANGYGGTGTLRENRLPRNCPLPTKKNMEKEARGQFSSTLEQESGIIYVRWMDNNVVTVASTCFGVEPIRPVERFSRKEKKAVSISRPDLIMQYNRNMGGTDLMDNNISCYRIGIRSKKWYWPIFTYLIDVVIQNAWILYRRSGRKITQLEFRRNIYQTYLTRYQVSARAPGRVSRAAGSDFRVSDDIRYDGLHHYVIPVPEGKRRRCGGINCTSRGRTMCSKCQIGLCVDCFRNFHTSHIR